MQDKQPNVSGDDNLIDLKEIFIFFWKKRKTVIRIVASSFVIMLLVCAAVFCFCPRKKVYSVSMSILLEQKNGQYLYPSGKPFSSADLLSHPVLWQVYEDCNLKEVVDFDRFQRSFFVSQHNPAYAKVDAQYQAKLNQKNITIVDVKQLERDYQEALDLSRSSLLTVSMIPDFPVSNLLATRIIKAVPQVWFDVYSKLEARPYPQMETSASMRELKKKIGKEGQLVVLEKSRQFCQQLIKMCDLLNNMLQGKNISLKSGEFIGDIRASLVSLNRYQINVLYQYVLTHPEYQGAFDRIFLESCLQNVNMDLARVKSKYDGAVESLNLVSSAQFAKPASEGAGSASVQLDGGIFHSIADLVRRDSTNDLRRIYAEKTMDYKEQSADLESDRIRYQDILGTLERNKVNGVKYTTITREQFTGHMQAMFDELLFLGDQVIQFRDRIIREFLSSRQFCAVSKDTKLISDPVYPLKRIFAGFFVLWLLVNFSWMVYLFCNREKAA